MSVRQRKEILDRLCKDFADYNLPALVTYSGYMKIVANPVLPRAIRKTYGNWARAVKAVQLARPDIFAPKPAPAPVVEPVKVEEPKVAKVAKPAPKPAVKKPVVSTSE